MFYCPQLTLWWLFSTKRNLYFGKCSPSRDFETRRNSTLHRLFRPVENRFYHYSVLLDQNISKRPSILDRAKWPIQVTLTWTNKFSRKYVFEKSYILERHWEKFRQVDMPDNTKRGVLRTNSLLWKLWQICQLENSWLKNHTVYSEENKMS